MEGHDFKIEPLFNVSIVYLFNISSATIGATATVSISATKGAPATVTKSATQIQSPKFSYPNARLSPVLGQ
jgi:hypothetical protein